MTNRKHKLPTNIPLGKKSTIPKKYNPSLLIALKREKITDKINYGIDTWNAYELYWLNDKKIPTTALCQITYASHSDYIIESKSLKLYLNSLNNTSFKSTKSIKETIKKDLEKKISTPVSITFNKEKTIKKINIPIIKIEKKITMIQPFTTFKFQNSLIKETLYTNTFRSICPVTSQPDFATLFITYSGKKIIKQTLYNYLANFYNKAHFHEECIEIIFNELFKTNQIKELTIQGSFLRRGGIDITPIRSNIKAFIQFPRIIRQ